MIVVTGANGVIGSEIMRLLMQDQQFSPYRIRALDIEPVNDCDFDFMTCDITNREEVTRMIKGAQIVFHQAGFTGAKKEKTPEEYFKTNIIGTLNILQACVDCQVKKLVFASTYFVYDLSRGGMFSEVSPIDPKGVYPAGKLICEDYIRVATARYSFLDSAILRYFRVYGGKSKDIISKLIGKVKAGQSVVLTGDGSQAFDYVHVKDVAKANLLAARMRTDGDAFNIGSGINTSLLQVTEMIFEMLSVDAEIGYNPAICDSENTFADISKARKVLNYRPTVLLKDGIAELI